MSTDGAWGALRGRSLPEWYDDAKVGVFLHWGLYSVPGWAPQVADIQTLFREHGPGYFFRNNPYAEWYRNTMRIEGSPTWVHHRETYGDRPYDDFIADFDRDSAGADLDALAGVCARAGARYVVLTTKHHDGFCLWPTEVANPHRAAYHARRDLVGELTASVRSAGMRMGLYYSGGYDWSHNEPVIDSAASALQAVPQDQRYVAACDAHLREIIERYEPSVLWNDIAAPADLDLAAIFERYYETVPDGVVNDRWGQKRLPAGAPAAALVRGAGWAAERSWKLLPARFRSFEIANRPPHYDFTTPEYAAHDDIIERKWEATRGVGHSFGANRNERPTDVVTATELVRMLVDVVAKNGNLLIGVGPEPNGSIPQWQQAPLAGMGEWLAVNGEAIYGTRPWRTATGETTEGSPVRFTQRGEAVYAILLETPGTATFGLRGIDCSGIREVTLLGSGAPVAWSLDGGELSVTVPASLPVAPAHVLRLGPAGGLQPR